MTQKVSDFFWQRLHEWGRAVQRCWVDHVASVPPHLRCEVSRLIARRMSEPAHV